MKPYPSNFPSILAVILSSWSMEVIVKTPFPSGLLRSTLNDFNPRRSFSVSSTVVPHFIKAGNKVATFEKFSSQRITFSIRTGRFFLSPVFRSES